MDFHISRAVIMRVKDFGESDLLVTFLTPDGGRLKGVAKGARRSRIRFPNCLDIFSLVKMEYQIRSNRDIHFLNSCRLINAFPHLRSSYQSLALASYIIELAEILFPQNVPDGRMFELIEELFLNMNEFGPADRIRVIFEGRAMALGGYEIDLDKCCLCGRPYTGRGMAVFQREKGGIACLGCSRQDKDYPGLEPETVKALKLIQTAGWPDVKHLPLSDYMIEELKAALRLHAEYRTGKRLKSTEYLD